MRELARFLTAVGVVAVSVGAAAAQRGDLPPVPITEAVSYTIQPRDTLDGIGAYFDVRVGCIREVNNLRISDLLIPGEVLVITPDCPAYDGTQVVLNPRTQTPGRDGTDGTYVIRPNDTLDTIGQELDVSVESLISANNITNNKAILAGQVLVIPDDAPGYGFVPALILSPGAAAAMGAAGDEPSVPGMTYVVVEGDTIQSIAESFDISTIVLRAVNRLGLEPDVPVGTELFVPEGASPFGTFPEEGEVARLTEGMGAGAIEGQTYVLQRNQTLDGVGALFNVNHYCLIERNGIINVRSITAGTLLIIPDDCGPYTGFDVVGTTEP
jgi:LysM repeat protein